MFGHVSVAIESVVVYFTNLTIIRKKNFHPSLCVMVLKRRLSLCTARCRGVATGVYRIYTPHPNQSTLNFLRGCFVSLTQDKLKLQLLVNIYTHPNQIPGYASGVLLCKMQTQPVQNKVEITRRGHVCLDRVDVKSWSCFCVDGTSAGYDRS